MNKKIFFIFGLGLGFAMGCRGDEVREERPDLYSIKEDFFSQTLKLREHRQSMIEKRADKLRGPVFAADIVKVPLVLHFRVQSPSELEVTKIRFKIDESSWYELPVLSAISTWHSFFIEQSVAGDRNLLLHLEALWKKDLNPILVGSAYLQSETFIPLNIEAKGGETSINVDVKKLGWFSPDLILRVAQLNPEPIK